MSELSAHTSTRSLVSWRRTLLGITGCCGLVLCAGQADTAVVTKNPFPFLQQPTGAPPPGGDAGGWWLRTSPRARAQAHQALPTPCVPQGRGCGDCTKWSRVAVGTPCGCAPLDGKLRPARSLHLCPGAPRAVLPCACCPGLTAGHCGLGAVISS